MAALREPTGRMLLAALALLLVSVPVLPGGWIYDDARMVDNPAMDDASDVLAVFWRTSADYLGGAREGGTETRTWRPITMLTLVATHAAWASPVLHHLVGWLLHAAVVALLLGADRRRATGWTLLVAGVALHPGLAEAWLYINGRSDLVAGLCLAGLWRASRMRGRSALLTVLALSVAGALAKETFLCAAPFVLLSRARCSARGRPGRRSLLILAAGALGLVVAILLGLLARPELGAASSTARLFDGRMLARVPALLGLATETFVVPIPRPMRSLAYELGPAAPRHLLWLVVPLAVAVLLVARRKTRPLLHLCGAMATLAPTVLVSDIFWLGFDRYLYMPAILLVTACAPELRTTRPTRRTWRVGLGLAAVLGLSTALSGAQYQGPDDFRRGILEGRPEDPAGYLMVAGQLAERGDRAAAFELLSRLPREHLTGATAHQAAQMLHGLRRPDLVVAVLEQTHEREPGHPFLQLDMIRLRGAQGRFAEALEIASTLRETPGFCELVRGELAPWVDNPRVPRRARDRATRLRRPCRGVGVGD